jgi:hypothetical protein
MKKWTPWEDVRYLSVIAGTHDTSDRPSIPDYPTVRGCSAKLAMSADDCKNALESGDIAELSLALSENILNTIMCAQESGIPLGIAWDALLEAIVAHSATGIPLDKETLISIMIELYGG